MEPTASTHLEDTLVTVRTAGQDSTVPMVSLMVNFKLFSTSTFSNTSGISDKSTYFDIIEILWNHVNLGGYCLWITKILLVCGDINLWVASLVFLHIR